MGFARFPAAPRAAPRAARFRAPFEVMKTCRWRHVLQVLRSFRAAGGQVEASGPKIFGPPGGPRLHLLVYCYVPQRQLLPFLFGWEGSKLLK